METLVYQADGLIMHSELHCGDADASREDTRPGVVVFPDAFGLGTPARRVAARLAELGYVALASDLHGEAQLHTELATARAVVGPLRENPLRLRARAEAALAALAARPEVDPTRMAAIGYCFGGTMALELARSGATLAAVVGFHGGLAALRPDDAVNIRGKVHVFLGADDPSIPVEQRNAFEAEMRAGKVDWQMTLFGGVVHSFTNPAADAMGRPDMARYDAVADARSWAGMLALFDEVFG